METLCDIYLQINTLCLHVYLTFENNQIFDQKKFVKKFFFKDLNVK